MMGKLVSHKASVVKKSDKMIKYKVFWDKIK